jgi:cold shock CspA family protein
MSITQKGKLIAWKDDKGFGFIKPDGRSNEKADIFLHIKAIKTGSPRPQVGDTIYYELEVGSNGKNRAVNAVIEGTFLPPASKPLSQNRQTIPREKRSGYTFGEVILTLSKTVVVIFFGMVVAWGILKIDHQRGNQPWSQSSCTKTPPRPECNIKGNVSQYYDNERMYIYHVPGGKYYAETVICPEEEERWFCSEAEAIAAGWRKSLDK